MINRSASTRLGVVLGAAALTAVACGGSGSGGTAKVATNPGGKPAAATTVTVETHNGPMGSYLTDGSGRTLYVFSADTGMSSTCSGACAAEWPPLTTSGSAKAAGGAQASMLGTTSRGDGSTQVTYAGHPLYYFKGDSKPGDTKGEGITNFGGTWDAVGTDGSALTEAPASSSSPSSSSGGGSSNGWG